MTAPWKVKVWGQGEPGCVSFLLGENLVVLDAGKALERLVADRAYWAGATQVWLLLSHYHAGHVAGLSAAQEFLRSGRTLRAAGPRDSGQPLSDLVGAGFEQISDQLLRDSTRCFELGENARLPEAPFTLETLAAMHPGICLGYRLASDGRSLVFMPDNELKMTNTEESRAGAVGKLELFARKAGLLIHDARYSNADYPSFKGRGHSNPSTAVAVALRAEASALLLYHADPKYGEAARAEMEQGAVSAASRKGAGPKCLLARDGLEVEL